MTYPPGWIGLEELAKRIGCTRSHVRRLALLKQLQHCEHRRHNNNPRGTWLFKDDEHLAFIVDWQKKTHGRPDSLGRQQDSRRLRMRALARIAEGKIPASDDDLEFAVEVLKVGLAAWDSRVPGERFRALRGALDGVMFALAGHRAGDDRVGRTLLALIENLEKRKSGAGDFPSAL